MAPMGFEPHMDYVIYSSTQASYLTKFVAQAEDPHQPHDQISSLLHPDLEKCQANPAPEQSRRHDST